MKDLSRFDRDYVQAGQYIDNTFLVHDVRFIAINDNVDTMQGSDGVLIPILNLMNEMYAGDISRKVRSSYVVRSSQGYPIGLCPYGYRNDPLNPKRWIIDDESADVVKEIYRLRLDGEGVTAIAQILKRRKILTPSIYMPLNGIRNHRRTSQRGDCFWDKSSVRRILSNRSYTGDVVNFKTYTKSYKIKTRYENLEEEWEIHENVHEPIVSRAVWEKVQESFQTRNRKPKEIEKNMFAGFLYCSDCGGKLNYKHLKNAPHNDYFSCHNKRQNNGLCDQTHHIRLDKLTEVVTKDISRVTQFADQFEDEFIKIVMDEHYKQTILTQDKNRRTLEKLRGRNRELERILDALYEDKVAGVISTDRYKHMSEKYDDEQIVLSQKIKHLQATVDEEKRSELNVEGFIEIVRNYTRINQLTPEILREFIDKIVVHHKEKRYGKIIQKIEIHYKMVGNVDVPSYGEQRQYVSSFSRTKKEDRIAI